jgi:hypothetical protein
MDHFGWSVSGHSLEAMTGDSLVPSGAGIEILLRGMKHPRKLFEFLASSVRPRQFGCVVEWISGAKAAAMVLGRMTHLAANSITPSSVDRL